MTEKHSVLITDKSSVKLHGIREIVSCTPELIVLYTVCGDLRIRGYDLQVNKAFSENGSLEISGKIKSLYYCDNTERYSDNFITRIFR